MDFPRKEVEELPASSILEFQITDWFVPETDKNREPNEDPELYSILMYGTTNEGNTVCAKIVKFEPWFYVKPPESWNSLSDAGFDSKLQNLYTTMMNEKYECFFKNKDTGITNKYNKKIIPNDYDSHFNGLSMVKKKDFWGFTNNTIFRYIKVSVKSLALYNNLKYYFNSLKDFKLYESNIDPFLRYIHIQNIKPCGWVRIAKYIKIDDETRCDYNIQVNWKHVIPIEINKIAPLLIASFDIECTSSHGDFPVAKKDYKKLAQDLANIAKAGYVCNDVYITTWIKNAYIDDVKIEDLVINRLYTKRKVVLTTIDEKLKPRMKEIINILEEISNISGDDDGDDGDDGDDVGDGDDNKPSLLSVKQQFELETKLNKILTDILPQLEGDKIIQIGTTVHKYGSDKIIYKHIISLNTCDDIDDTDVVICTNEADLIKNWKDIISRLNPDVLIGYNIFGFDMEYIWIRAQENGILDEFAIGLGKTFNRKVSLIKQQLASSALGENVLKYFDMDGTVIIDLFKVMQREEKLDSYKLDNVATIFLGDKKDDIKPHEIFQKFKGSSKDRCDIAKYCIQDCALVNRLLHKLKLVENNIAMGNVCLVPLNFLFRRGQGIKIFSLIAKQCMDKDLLIPVIRSFNSDFEIDVEGYEGAIVLDPKEGMYLNDPIVVFDYGSLYPSSMIARNLSHDCYVIDKKYMVKDSNIEYITVNYDLYEGVGDKKKKSGVKECIFAKYKDGKKGIIAEILSMLLQERKNTKEKIKYKTAFLKNGTSITGSIKDKGDTYDIINIDTQEKNIVNKIDIMNIKNTYDNFEQDVFDGLQLAYKITANSLYGQIGARTSPIYLKDIAACTTATGREMIMMAKNYVETEYHAEVIYGDSVMPYTPITYKINNKIHISTFEKLDGDWIEYNNFKPDDTDRYNKEQFIPTDMCVWTHKGWAKINKIIRHKTIKKIYRILTNTGLVDVTADHSLLNEKCEIIKPSDCVIGQELLHSKPEIIIDNISKNSINNIQSYLYGIFVNNGYCDENLWYVTILSKGLIKKCKELFERNEKCLFKIIDNKIVPLYNKDIVELSKKYRLICYTNNICDAKIVPEHILNGDISDIEAFKNGLVISNVIHSYSNISSFTTNYQITAQSYCVMLQLLNFNISLKYIDNIYIISYNKIQNQYENAIKDIKILHDNYDGYVYDIETEAGVFHGGIGNIILKNTDSIFCKFPLKDDEGNDVYGKDALSYAIKVGNDVAKNIVKIMPAPQQLNYEKSLYPFIIFSKKRYVGNLYENNDKDFKQKSMGIVLKRRDNAPIVKKIYGGIIDILLNKQDLNLSIEFLKEELTDMVNGKTPIHELIISKSLRGSYKDPTKIAHKVLADRIGARDPGNKPAVNDRVPYVYIKVPDAKLQGDRIENPDYIIQNSITPDYLHYITNQIMKPVLQMYALCLEQLPNYDKPSDYWKKVEEELLLKPIYIDDKKRKNRLDNLKLNMVKELLFDEYIYMLSEPKIKSKKIKKDAVIKKNKSDEDTDVVVKTPKIKKQKDKINDTVIDNSVIEPIIVCNEYLKATIKVVKKTGTGQIIASGILFDKNKKNIWEYTNEKCKSKENEIKYIIQKMLTDNKDVKIIFNINNKPFVKDYKIALAKYNNFNKNTDDRIIEKAIENNDIGILSDINEIISYKNILELKDRFIIE